MGMAAPRSPRRADALSQQCTAKSKRSQERCRNWAMRGLTVCRMHGGRSPEGEAYRRRVVAQHNARTELERLGVPIQTHPIDALLGQVWEAAGNVEFLRRRVAGLDQGRGLVSVPKGPAGELPAEGLYGPDHQGDGKPHVLVAMYDAERERLAKFAKMALDAGVDERRVRIAEAQGQHMASVVQAAVRAAITDGEQAGLKVAADLMRQLGSGA